MAVLDSNQRFNVLSDYCSAISADREPFNLSSSDMTAAVAAVDDWVNNNQGSFNSALPTAAQSGMTAAQKARLLQFIVQKRYVEGV